MRESYLEVDLDAIAYNIDMIQTWIGEKKLIPVIKANAYGTGVLEVLKIIQEKKIDLIAVALVEEGIFLRENGYLGQILLLNHISLKEIEEVIAYDLIPSISILERIKQLNESAKSARKVIPIHLEIDTGMGRTGFGLQECERILQEIKESNFIELQGIYSHFSSADTNQEYSKKQEELFNQVLSKIKEKQIKVKYVHMAASGGILYLKQMPYEYVRPGLVLYGYLPEKTDQVTLRPSTRLKSNITYLKTVPKGTYISYNRTYQTKRETIVATIPVGYADGYRRELSNKGYVVIQGKLAPIIGQVCMDNFMVDVTEIPNVKLGQEVWLWDNKLITVEQIAQWCNTINYEILATIGSRLPRKYRRGDKNESVSRRTY